MERSVVRWAMLEVSLITAALFVAYNKHHTGSLGWLFRGLLGASLVCLVIVAVAFVATCPRLRRMLGK